MNDKRRWWWCVVVMVMVMVTVTVLIELSVIHVERKGTPNKYSYNK